MAATLAANAAAMCGAGGSCGRPGAENAIAFPVTGEAMKVAHDVLDNVIG